jgi:ribosomal protein S4E
MTNSEKQSYRAQPQQYRGTDENMKCKSSSDSNGKVKDGARCKVVGGTHAGKSGIVRDINTSKTGHVTITVVQADGERFKTLAKHVVVN